MSNSDQKAKAKDIAALREWWAGDREKPFLLSAEGRDYCACYLLFNTAIEKFGLSLKCLLAWLAEQLPFSSSKVFLYKLAGVKMGMDVFISPGVVIDPLYPELVELGDGCLLGLGAMILTHEYTAKESRIGRVRIGRDSVIGARAVVRSGVSIGEGCTIGACSFVNKDVPDGASVAGVPAKAIEAKGAR